MSNQIQMRQQTEHPEITAQRHATALAEIQRMRDDHARMQMELAEERRENDRLRNMVELLETDKEHYRRNAAIFQRKLIRLAAAMESIGKLSDEASAIMKDARDFEEEAQKVASGATGNKHEAETASEIISLLHGAGRSGEGK